MTAKVSKRYQWGEVVMTYMAEPTIRALDEVIVMDHTDDKASEAIYAQLIAKAWGYA